MCAAARLHPNETRCQLSEKRNYLRTLQLLAQRHLASRIDAVYLEDEFCQIDPNLRNVHLGRSCWFKWLLDTSTLAQVMPLKAGASMPLEMDTLRFRTLSTASDPPQSRVWRRKHSSIDQ